LRGSVRWLNKDSGRFRGGSLQKQKRLWTRDDWLDLIPLELKVPVKTLLTVNLAEIQVLLVFQRVSITNFAIDFVWRMARGRSYICSLTSNPESIFPE
jgi:hypothetical protein